MQGKAMGNIKQCPEHSSSLDAYSQIESKYKQLVLKSLCIKQGQKALYNLQSDHKVVGILVI